MKLEEYYYLDQEAGFQWPPVPQTHFHLSTDVAGPAIIV